LLKEFPYIIVPPLPSKKKKETEKSIKRREIYLTKFLQGVMRSEELKSSQFLVSWLTIDDPKDFPKVMKAAEKAKGPVGMDQIRSLQGVVQG